MNRSGSQGDPVADGRDGNGTVMSLRYAAKPGMVAALRIFFLVPLLIGALSAFAAAAEVVNIRFGMYPNNRVRVVLDTDQPVPYKLEPSPDGRALSVLLPGITWKAPL